MERIPVEFEQYECQNCKRYFYLDAKYRKSDDQILCPFGCAESPYHGAGKHIKTLRTEIYEVIKMDIKEIDLTEKYVIMKTREELNLDVIDRVYFCKHGIGCDPDASGTKIYGYFITDPEKVYVRRNEAVRLATDDEVKQAKERFRKNKTWALEKWKRYQVDKKRTFADLLKERGGFYGEN